MAAEKLAVYKSKRDFAITSEPAEGGEEGKDALSFVVQKHWATRLHYDFRIELDGVMLSWAVPKGPSYDPKDKRLAARVEDHPISIRASRGRSRLDNTARARSSSGTTGHGTRSTILMRGSRRET